MNKELMLRVADAVQAEKAHGVKVELDMTNWHDQYDRWFGLSCGTTACIGGFVDILISDKKAAWLISKGYYSGQEVYQRAKAALELSAPAAEALMIDREMFKYINRNAKYVPDALRWMAVTGRVDWKKGIEVARCAERAR